jgi:hypothetical protein
MYYTIYKITNKINNKFYIGKHKTKKLDDGYMGSGKLIKAAIKKHGKENFEKEILGFFNTEKEMDEAEKIYVVLSESSYNLCPGGEGGWGYVNENKLSPIMNPETKVYQNGRKATDLILESKYGENWRSVLSNIANSKLKAILEKDPLYLSSKIGSLNHFFGKNHTSHTKQKMSLSHKHKHNGEKNSQFGTIWITDGTNNKKIKLDEPMPDNWYRGRNINAFRSSDLGRLISD